jgi:hypothetical protein
MSIEVRHLVVKVKIEQERSTPASQFYQDNDIDHIKTQLLNQCHQIITDTIRREKER